MVRRQHQDHRHGTEHASSAAATPGLEGPQPASAALGTASALRFCCPKCRGPLTPKPDAYGCAVCSREYPIVFGIPDFRLSPDPYISFEDEYRKAGHLAEQAGRGSFADLVRFYWELTPDVPAPAVGRYIQYALSGDERGKACLEVIDAQLHARWIGDSCLEIGCGTGGFLLPARERFHEVVGTDIALRWLVVARKRLEGASGPPPVLICCSAEHLPFPDEAFDGAVGLHVLEHTQSPQAVLTETARTLRPGGVCYLSTPNRFSLGPEPCVRVWGVGFLPRAMASGYVQLVKGIPYRNIRLLSALELRTLLARSGLRAWTITPGAIAACEQRAVSGPARSLIKLYLTLRALPALRPVLQLVGPLLEVLGRK